MLKIYHNPRCSKSRQTLALLIERGLEPQIIDYLGEPLSASELKALAQKLGLTSVRDMMRRGEAAYKDGDLKTETDEMALINAIAEHPKLLERPIVETKVEARIGRPPEAVLDIL